MNHTEISWMGYKRKDGRKGIRNRVLVIYTVKCAEHVARKIVDEVHHPEVELLGFDGCTDNQYAVNMLISLIRHPNVGAVLTVGLGCEYVQPEWLEKIALQEEKISSWIRIQDEGGTVPSIKKGVAWVREALKELENTPRVQMALQDLVIGAECGGSDYTSGLAGNVVVGRLFDQLVKAGGTAIFEEIVEAVGLDWLLTSRAASETAKEEIQYTYDRKLCRRSFDDRRKEYGSGDQKRFQSDRGSDQSLVPAEKTWPLAFGFDTGSLLDAVRDHKSE